MYAAMEASWRSADARCVCARVCGASGLAAEPCARVRDGGEKEEVDRHLGELLLQSEADETLQRDLERHDELEDDEQ